MEKSEIAQNEQFHLFPQCFRCNLLSLYSFNSHISVVVCCFFEFGMFSYLVGYIREWVKVSHLPKLQNLILALSKLKADLYPAADNYFKMDLAQTKRFFFDNVEKKKCGKKEKLLD